jgi:hypothetical protein
MLVNRADGVVRGLAFSISSLLLLAIIEIPLLALTLRFNYV